MIKIFERLQLLEEIGFAGGARGNHAACLFAKQHPEQITGKRAGSSRFDQYSVKIIPVERLHLAIRRSTGDGSCGDGDVISPFRAMLC